MAQANIISDIQIQFQSFFQNLSVGKKASLFIALGAVIIGLGSMVYLSRQITYVSLATGISQKDTALVAKRLDESQIPYVISPGGNGILVDSTLIDRARLDIADSGLISDGIVGLEIFDKSDISATEFQQNVQYRRAIEGELARLIMKINSVESAKVILAIPKESIFIDESKKPSASVHVNVKNSQLSPKRVNTIINLIVGAVPGMFPEEVKISDQFGNLYTGVNQANNFSEQREKNFNYASTVERHMETKLYEQLSKITGKNGMEVNVSATVNFDVEEIEENTIDPESSTLLSEEVIDEKSTGSRSIPVGVPGVTSNSPEIRTGSSEVANVSDVNKRTKRSNFENSKRFVKKRTNAGKLERISISILLDDRVKEKLSDDGAPISFKEKWTRDELDKIALIAKNSVGFNEDRGDSIEVRNISFIPITDTKLRELELKKQAEREFWMGLAKYVFFTVLVLIMILFVIRPMARKLMQTPEDMNMLMGLPTTIGEMEGEELEIPDAQEQSEIPSRDRILDLARESPEQTASMIRFWLKEAK